MSGAYDQLIQHSAKGASLFTRLTRATARWCGKPATFFVALGIIVVWALSGPVFGFNDTWQLAVNTSTTIITFLIVFIIQNSQNCDSAAMQIKLDELISKLEGAREELLDLEEMDQDKLEKLRRSFEKRARSARKKAGGSAAVPSISPPTGGTVA